MPTLTELRLDDNAKIIINTETPFPISGEGALPLTCRDIVNKKKGQSTDAFLNDYKLTQINKELKDFQGSTQLATYDKTQNISQKPGYVALNNFLTSIENTYLPVYRLVGSCISENLGGDKKAYNKAKATSEESKARLESILTPEQHLSYYDGWFPIFRPMTEISLFFIFGSAIFMLLVSILLFLRMGGVQIQVYIPELTSFNNIFPPGTSYYMYGGLATGLILTYIAFKLGYV
jgi:hypothetical protein